MSLSRIKFIFFFILMSAVVSAHGVTGLQKSNSVDPSVACLPVFKSADSLKLKKNCVGHSNGSVIQSNIIRLKKCDLSNQQYAQSGCCSWHKGVCGCSGGRAVCCDGTLSPSCGC